MNLLFLYLLAIVLTLLALCHMNFFLVHLILV